MSVFWSFKVRVLLLEKNFKISEASRNKAEEVISRQFSKFKRTYGAPRIWKKFKEIGFSISKNTVARMMKKLGLKAVQKAKYKTQRKEAAPNPFFSKRIFRTTETKIRNPNKFWAGDITYIRNGSRWNYLSVVMDLFNREIIGRSFDVELSSKGAVKALEMASSKRDTKNVVFHSDRGVQYSRVDFRDSIEKRKMKQSKSRKGNCYENTFVESFLKTLKTELPMFEKKC